MARSLSQLNPRDAWQPASPTVWGPKWTAHLYRRAAFAVPPRSLDDTKPAWERLQTAVKRGQRDCIEQVLEGESGLKDFDDLTDTVGEQVARQVVRRFGNRPQKLQGWWLYRMLYTPHPLRERLTLFWHDHFATSLAKVAKAELMLKQNLLLRKHAMGKFEPFLQDVSRDPAMLIWLDSNSNVKGRPNENYAREVMELFSLGVGNYTEKDIQEAARAFTGWATDGKTFLFNAALHDDGRKTLLGETGKWNGEDVVRIALKQPAAAKFLVHKLYREFISEADDPPERLLAPLVESFRKSRYDIRACVATMLRSNLFFSEHAYRQRIKSPVEYVIGSLNLFDARGSMEVLATAMEGMGQTLFAPPNVKGWDGGKAWLNTATLLARHNFASKLVHGNFRRRLKVDVARLASQYAAEKSPRSQADFLVKLLLQGDVDPAVEKRLVAYSTTKETTESKTSRIAAIAHAVMTAPEYQLA